MVDLFFHHAGRRLPAGLFRITSAAFLALALSHAALAQTANIIPIGSPLTFGGANAPDTYSAVTTFSSTPVQVDNGAVTIWQEQVPTSTNGEWDVFYMKTTNGGPVAGNVNGDWNIVMNYVLSAPAIFDGVANQWLVNGVPVSPLTNGIGSICCAVTSNPILPGTAYYGSGFNAPFPAGTQSNWQQIYVDPYSLVSAGGVNPNTANEFVFALHFTLQAAAPTVLGVISASGFGAFPTFAPGSWIEIYGTALSGVTMGWGAGNFTGVNGPTTLGNTSVTIDGQPAFVAFVSPLQVNVQVAGGVATGTQNLVVTTAAGSSPPFAATVNDTQPGLLAPPSWDINGTQYVVAQFADYSFVLPPGSIAGLTTQRAQPGDTIILYGIGFGPVTPDTPPGQLVQQLNSINGAVSVSIGGVPAKVTYDGLSPNYMGLYQFNVVVPNVPASDTTPLTFTLGGVSGTQTLSIAIGS
jgi:uncharacterized protein (TIGR03437 family)